MSYLDDRMELILKNVKLDDFYQFIERHDKNKKQFNYFLYKFTTQSTKVNYLIDEIAFYFEFFSEIAEKINQNLSKSLLEKKEKISVEPSLDNIFSFYLLLFHYSEQFEYLYREANFKMEKADAFLNIFSFK